MVWMFHVLGGLAGFGEVPGNVRTGHEDLQAWALILRWLGPVGVLDDVENEKHFK